jgi:hypothetical protein
MVATAQTRTLSHCPAGPPRQKVPPIPGGTRKDGADAGSERTWQSPPTSSTGRRDKARRPAANERNLRDKRSDPSRGANGRPAAGAVPVARVPTRQSALQACQHPVRRDASGRKFPNRAKRPHSTDSGWQQPGRSRHETDTSARCGEWRRGAHGPRKRTSAAVYFLWHFP